MLLRELTGQKFGRLTVIKRSYPNDRYNHANWLCKCNCGKEKIIKGDCLTRGITKSCGCFRREKAKSLGKRVKLDLGIASMHQRFYAYKSQAKFKGLIFELTEEQFHKITQKNCYYCGAKPNNIQNTPGTNGNYIYNGIDRVDNSKGYTLDNVVPCCWLCNSRKGAITLQEFKDWIGKVYNNMKGNKM
jgi:hypothetical protein